MSRHLVIVHPGTLGDMLLALPALHALRTAYPSHMVGLVAAQQVGQLFKVSGEVQAVFGTEGDALTSLYMGADACRGSLRGFLDACDLAVCWVSDSDERLVSTFRALGVQTVLVRSPGSYAAEPLHQTDRYLATIEQVASASAAFQGIRLPDALMREARIRLRGLELGTHPVVIIHPGSGSPHKCVDPEFFETVVHWCERRGATPIMLQGPADEKAVSRLRAMVPRVPVLQNLDLQVMAAVLSQASLFVGHDSGVSHLAAALRVPTVALFGPTDPRRWAPRGPSVRVLRGAACLCADWTDVRACDGKPCLNISLDRLTIACDELLPQMNAPADQLVLPGELC